MNKLAILLMIITQVTVVLATVYFLGKVLTTKKK